MRFTIEQRHLTDSGGKPIAHEPESLSFHNLDASTADDAVRLFIKKDGGELLGDILRFPGFQAVAGRRFRTAGWRRPRSGSDLRESSRYGCLHMYRRSRMNALAGGRLSRDIPDPWAC